MEGQRRGFLIKEMMGTQRESATKPTQMQFCMYVGDNVECSYSCLKCQQETMMEPAVSRRKKLNPQVNT